MTKKHTVEKKVIVKDGKKTKNLLTIYTKKGKIYFVCKKRIFSLEDFKNEFNKKGTDRQESL